MLLTEQILGHLKDASALNSVLAGAGVSGALGGIMTSQTAQRPGETPGGRRWRIIRNALLASAAGGGAVALGQAGVKELNNAVPAGDKDPVWNTLGGGVSRSLLGLGTFGALNRKVIGTGPKSVSDAATAQKTLRNLLTAKDSTLGPEGQAALSDNKPLDLALKQPESGMQIRKALQERIDALSASGPQKPKIFSSTLDKLEGSPLQRELVNAGLPSTLETGGTAVAQNGFRNDLRALAQRTVGIRGPTLAATTGLRKFLPPAARTALAIGAAAVGPQLIEGGFGLGKDMLTGGNHGQ